MNNERFPRTLSEAFGPHTSTRIEPPPLTPMEVANRELNRVGFVILAIGIVSVACLALGAWEILS